MRKAATYIMMRKQKKQLRAFARLERGDNRELLDEALRVASRSDIIVAALGECAEMSGESASRTSLEIPDAQQDLLKALVKTGKPVVLLLFTGRPLVLNWEDANVHSILNVWFGGSEQGTRLPMYCLARSLQVAN